MSKKLVRNFASSRKGNFALMASFLLVPLIGGIGVAIDYTSISTAKVKLQNALDAGALWAGRKYEKTRTVPTVAEMENYLRANYEGGISDVKIIQVGDEFTIAANTVAPGYFYAGIYPDAFKLKTEAAVPTSGDNVLEVALSLDVTGSMRGQKIADLKSAADEFLTNMEKAAATGTDIKIGLVPFTYHVNVGQTLRGAAWLDAPSSDWKGCVGSRRAPYITRDGDLSIKFPGVTGNRCPKTPILDLTKNLSTVKKTVAGLQTGGATYMAPGVMWGLRLLSYKEPFTSGSAANGVKKVLVVMTDGDNTRSAQQPNSPLNRGKNLVDANSKTLEACREAKTAGITIYSIAFGKTISDDGKAVMRNCASTPANYYDAKDGDQLSDAFKDIAKEIFRLRLTG